MKSGEDVDLCWRFIEAGARLRYEPIALVAHDHRTQLREWFARKAFYGSSAAPLAVRHPGKTAPLVISGWTLLVWLLLAMGSGFGYLASTVVAAITGRRIAKSLGTVDTEPKEVAVVAAARPVVGGAAAGLGDLPALLADGADRSRCCSGAAARWCWSPPSSTGWSTGSRRNGNADDDTKRVGLLTYLLLKRLDDIAYGLGLWTGVVRERHLGALKPQIRT